MKNKVLSVLLALILCMCLAVTAYGAESEFLVDEAQLLSEAESAALTDQLAELSAKYHAQIVIVTLNATEGGDIDTYVEHYYDSNGLGYGTNHDGVLLMVGMDLREYRILSNGMAGDAIGSGAISDISDAIASDISDGDYADAFSAFAEYCDYYLDGHINGFPFALGKNLVISLIIGALIGLVVASVLKGQLKSVRKKEQAHDYVVPGSMEITTRRDQFLYRDTTRTKKESGDSKSGGSRNVGGGSF